MFKGNYVDQGSKGCHQYDDKEAFSGLSTASEVFVIMTNNIIFLYS